MFSPLEFILLTLFFLFIPVSEIILPLVLKNFIALQIFFEFPDDEIAISKSFLISNVSKYFAKTYSYPRSFDIAVTNAEDSRLIDNILRFLEKSKAKWDPIVLEAPFPIKKILFFYTWFYSN